MRVRLVAFVLAAALVLAPTGAVCEMACSSNVSRADGTEPQSGHAHHHASADGGGVVLQATPHECKHGGAPELVVATRTRADTPLLFAPIVVSSIHVAEFDAVVLVRSGSPRDRAAPPGTAPSLPHLRI